MSRQLGRVVSQILNRYFGEIVEKVGNDLFMYGCKPMGMIIKSTGLPRTQVIESLRTLLKFDLATFEAKDVIVDYKLQPENILLLIRYPRYLLQMKTKYGSEAEMLVEELLQQASCTATVLIVSVMNKYKDDKEKNLNIVKLKDTFISLATAGYIQQAPVAEINNEIPVLVPVATIVPDLDVRELINAMNSNLNNVSDNIYWKVNYDRFHLDFRDEVMIKAVTRRIDDNAGELLKLMLEQMYLSSSSWASDSSPVPLTDLKDGCQRIGENMKNHVEQYLRVIEESTGFIRRTGDAGGGQYSVRIQHALIQLVEAVCDHTVTERLGGKAARIFRLIRSKKYLEEDDIQKNAMLPNKECKELTYKLLEEHFISVQPMRKTASAGGMAKAIYLYHVKLHDVAHVVRDMCYRSLHNVMSVSRHRRVLNARLLEKKRRVRTIVHGMRLRGEPQQNIDDVLDTLTPPEVTSAAEAERRLSTLAASELHLDRALFILTSYFTYQR
ncbi:DNA-directed RNA polymerase III subunit RPC3-like [Danaus plexippus]|uniref:DNA-directed RNA polymerase III subunit RPC3 n=1 Tax=Danaus plexippus plexippus TaxID=278856 RepID=A0A212EPS1_DANPL|nr:DNA-directed RNA polymerase III subunit RPC3-like [Danaus plexippus]OWR43464.1 putative DNA-directed RNA polymerase III 62-kS-subunit [Danaus plexippus plexippus]